MTDYKSMSIAQLRKLDEYSSLSTELNKSKLTKKQLIKIFKKIDKSKKQYVNDIKLINANKSIKEMMEKYKLPSHKDYLRELVEGHILLND